MAGRKRAGTGRPVGAARPRTTPPPPKQARSRATRNRVLRAAVACFERHGFEATTTALVAARAGVAVGSVYNHFADKRALILELLEETQHTLADRIIAGLDPASWRGRIDPRVRTRQLIDAVFRSQGLRPGIQRILWGRYFNDPDFVPPFEAIRAGLEEAIVAFLAAVDAQGLCRPGLDRRVAPVVILNAVQWNATQAYLQGDPRSVARLARATSELVERYVFADSADAPVPARVRRTRSR